MNANRIPAAVLAAALAAGGCAAAGAGDRSRPPHPRERVPPSVRQEWLHFTDPVVSPGDEAPGFSLPAAEGGSTLSLALFRGRPLVLVFGSYT